MEIPIIPSMDLKVRGRIYRAGEVCLCPQERAELLIDHGKAIRHVSEPEEVIEVPASADKGVVDYDPAPVGEDVDDDKSESEKAD